MARFLILTISNVFGLVELLLLIRAILKALSANAAALFVEFIYKLTDFILFPIEGIFSNLTFSLGVIDIVAIAGMVIYLIVFMIIFKIFTVISGEG